MKTEVTKTIEAITEYLESLDNHDLIMMHNEYCQECGHGDDEIYGNDEDFFETFFNGNALKAVRAAHYGNYNFSHENVKFNGYGNLESFNDPADHVSIPDIAKAIFNGQFEPSDIELIEEEE